MVYLYKDIRDYIMSFLRHCYKCNRFQLGNRFTYGKNGKIKKNKLCMTCTHNHFSLSGKSGKELQRTYKVIMSYSGQQLKNNSFWIGPRITYDPYNPSNEIMLEIKKAKEWLIKKYLNRIFGHKPDPKKIEFKVKFANELVPCNMY